MTHPTRSDLERFFSPKSVAIIGASQDLITISGQPLSHLINHGYTGKLYPVNPRYQEILGRKCYPSLADLPEVPDLVLILINAARVADMLEQCGKKGVPYVVIFSSGFSETGGDGVAHQVDLAGAPHQAAGSAAARRSGAASTRSQMVSSAWRDAM